MTIPNYYIHTITRYRIENDTTFDIYGNPEDIETELEYKGWVSQIGTTEQSIDRNTTVADFIVYLPGSADVVSTDELSWEDIRMRIVGEPHKAYTPNSGVHHIELTARKVTE